MSYKFLVIAGALAVSACTSVSNKPLSAEASAQLQGKTVAQSKYQKSDFAAFTAGKAAFAVLGAAAMFSEGNQIVKDNNIEDPAISISSGLAEKLAKARSVKVIEATSIASNDKVDVLVKTYSGADYLLDVKTLSWMFNYYPTDWSHYKVTYNARMRLIDAKNKTVLAETSCATVQGDDKNPPTKDDLLNNNATLLKSYLDKAASACVDLLSKNILMLES